MKKYIQPLIFFLGIAGVIFGIFLFSVFVLQIKNYPFYFTLTFEVTLLVTFFISEFIYFRFYFQKQGPEKSQKELLKQGLLFYIGALLSPVFWFGGNALDTDGMTIFTSIAVCGFLGTVLFSLGSFIYLITLFLTRNNTTEASV